MADEGDEKLQLGLEEEDDDQQANFDDDNGDAEEGLRKMEEECNNLANDGQNGNHRDGTPLEDESKASEINFMDDGSAMNEDPSAAPKEPEAQQPEDASLVDNEAYKHLREQNVDPRVATELVKLYESGAMVAEDIDERALEMLRSFRPDQAVFVISQVRESNLIGVQNKAQFLMAVMRNFRDRLRTVGAQSATAQPLVQGPDRQSIQSILDRTGYALEVTVGQRKYGGPPPEWEGPATGPIGSGHEIYIGHVPKELYEDALIPLFEEVGKIWDLRLMMDPMTGRNRGYAFLTYCEKAFATAAAKKFDGHEIQPGKKLKVNVSVANTRLFLGNIPKSKSKDEILAELKNCTEGVVDVIIYTSPDSSESRKNRGFCFVDFVDHKAASDAKRKFGAGKLRPWNCDLVVDWAEQQDEPDDETMAKVKVLYVRHLREAVTEEQLKEIFGVHGEVERAKKIRDYAFIHFADRDSALKAMEALNNHEMEGVKIEVSLAKPQMDKNKREGFMRGRGRGGPMGWQGGYGGPGGGQFPMGGGGFRGRGRGGGGGYDDHYGGGGPRGRRPPFAGPMGGGGPRGFRPPPPDYGYGYGGHGGGYGGGGGYEDYYDNYYDPYGGGGGGYGGGGYGGGYPPAPSRGRPPMGGRGRGRGGPRGARGGGGARGGPGGGRGRGNQQKRPAEDMGGGPGAKRAGYGGEGGQPSGDWSSGGGAAAGGGYGQEAQLDFSMDVNAASF
uniref:RRM domain-containing protein n=2 Tax=Plectus sambesii TaxID=2011161 RepID=A0A914UVT6_9BILA